jgi:hypothetical protein
MALLFILQEMGGYFELWRQALPRFAFFVVHVSHSRNVLPREMLGLAPSRITRIMRLLSPDGHTTYFLVIAGNAFIIVGMLLQGF